MLLLTRSVLWVLITEVENVDLVHFGRTLRINLFGAIWLHLAQLGSTAIYERGKGRAGNSR